MTTKVPRAVHEAAKDKYLDTSSALEQAKVRQREMRREADAQDAYVAELDAAARELSDWLAQHTAP